MAETAPSRPVVNFITGNAGKLSEVRAILEPAIEVRSHTLDIEEIQGTIEEVTEAKCRKAADMINGPVLVDDTSLCFRALNGLPGPYMYVSQKRRSASLHQWRN
jgi:inosine triphosphate pyrophosphatase